MRRRELLAVAAGAMLSACERKQPPKRRAAPERARAGDWHELSFAPSDVHAEPQLATLLAVRPQLPSSPLSS